MELSPSATVKYSLPRHTSPTRSSFNGCGLELPETDGPKHWRSAPCLETGDLPGGDAKEQLGAPFSWSTMTLTKSHPVDDLSTPSPSLPPMVFSFAPLQSDEAKTLTLANLPSVKQADNADAGLSKSQDDKQPDTTKADSVDGQKKLTAIDQLLLEYDIIQSDDQEVVFTRAGFEPHPERPTEVKVLPKATILRLRESPPMSIVNLLKACKEPVALKSEPTKPVTQPETTKPIIVRTELPVETSISAPLNSVSGPLLTTEPAVVNKKHSLQDDTILPVRKLSSCSQHSNRSDSAEARADTQASVKSHEETTDEMAKKSGSTSLPPLSTMAVANKVDSFLHGQRANRSSQLSDSIQSVLSDTREKSSSTPSLISAISNASGSSSDSYYSAMSELDDTASGNASKTTDASSSSNSSATRKPSAISSLATATATAATAARLQPPAGHKRRPSTLIQITNPSYKSKCEDFNVIFEDHLPLTERLIADFSCAYFKNIHYQGRIYISQHYFAFYANWMSLYERWQIIKCADVISMVKANTMLVIPNAIHITTKDKEKHIFASFGARDRAFEVMSTVWKAVMASDAEKTATETTTESRREKPEAKPGNTCSADGGSSTCTSGTPPVAAATSNSAPAHSSAVQQPAVDASSHLCSSMTNAEMWNIVKGVYGKNLGLSHQEQCDIAGIELSVIGGSDLPVVEESEEALSAAGKESDAKPSAPAESVSAVEQPTTVSNANTNAIASRAISCPCSNDHYGTIIFDRTFPVDVDKIYELIFKCAESNQLAMFQDQFLRSRETTDLQLSKWATLEGASQTELAKSCKDLGTYAALGQLFKLEAIQGRSLEYTVQLNHVMCKTCYTREKQYLLQHQPGQCYVVHSEAKNEGPPYSDCFTVNSTWCITSLGDGLGARIQVQFKISWLKSSFSLNILKGTIEKSSREGLTDVVNAMVKRMEMEFRLIEPDAEFLASKSLPDTSPVSSTANSNLAALNEATPGGVEATANTEVNSTAVSTVAEPNPANIRNLKILMLFLLFLLLTNLVLILKLYQIEGKLQDLAHVTFQLLNDGHSCLGVTDFAARPDCMPSRDEL